MMTARTWLVYCLLPLSACAGCGVPYVAKPGPTPTAELMPAARSEGDVMVAADPYVEGTRLEAMFNLDLRVKGILPIQLLVKNESSGRVWLQRGAVRLLVSTGPGIPPTRATQVATMAIPPAPYTPGEIATAALINLPLLLILNELTAGRIELLSQMGSKAELLPHPNGRTDYWRKELKDVILANGESAHGFVYFAWPAEIRSPVDDLILLVPLVDIDEAERLVIRLPLSGVHFGPPPLTPQD